MFSPVSLPDLQLPSIFNQSYSNTSTEAFLASQEISVWYNKFLQKQSWFISEPDAGHMEVIESSLGCGGGRGQRWEKVGFSPISPGGHWFLFTM